jgi:hypothetical protein
MLRLLPPLCWTGLIAYLGGSQWGGAHTSAWIVLLALDALGQRRTIS